MSITAKSGMAQLLDKREPKTAIWGYEGRVPGPTIRVRQNQEVWVNFKNDLEQPSTIHWHGIRIDNRMDGVAGLTQAPVEPGATFEYRFRVPDAGTFWYHPHNRSWEQMARGLYGVLIVEEPNPPEVDKDITLVLDDWRLQEDGAIHTASFGSIGDRSHGGRLGNVLTINGEPFGDVEVQANERIRLRLVNTCNSRILNLRIEDLPIKLIALDGQAVQPFDLKDGRLTLAPAQRADLLVDMMGEPGRKVALTEVTRQRFVIGHFFYDPSAAKRDKPLTSTVELAAANIPAPELASPQDVELVMTGGAMSGIQGAKVDGVYWSISQLVKEHGYVWAQNGTAGRSDQPLFRSPRGRTVRLKMVNQTPWPHAMHIHGHHFQVIARSDGRAVKPHWRDTVLMDPDSELTLAFVADNPGKWMIHCHMLEHQAGGMATWFEVWA